MSFPVSTVYNLYMKCKRENIITRFQQSLNMTKFKKKMLIAVVGQGNQKVQKSININSRPNADKLYKTFAN